MAKKGQPLRRGKRSAIQVIRPPKLTAPAGLYDPALDAALGASNRGLGDLEDDIGRQNFRDIEDAGFQRDSLDRLRDQSLADLGTRESRFAEDTGTSLSRLLQDTQQREYQTQRSYNILGNRQAQQQRQAGLTGGAAAEAAGKRGANKALDDAAISQAYERAKADTDKQVKRFNEETATQRQRIGEGHDLDAGRLDLLLSRGLTDRIEVDLPRAKRENLQFGLDTEASKLFQVGQVAPEVPAAFEREASVFDDLYRPERKTAAIGVPRYPKSRYRPTRRTRPLR